MLACRERVQIWVENWSTVGGMERNREEEGELGRGSLMRRSAGWLDTCKALGNFFLRLLFGRSCKSSFGQLRGAGVYTQAKQESTTQVDSELTDLVDVKS